MTSYLRGGPSSIRFAAMRHRGMAWTRMTPSLQRRAHLGLALDPACGGYGAVYRAFAFARANEGRLSALAGSAVAGSFVMELDIDAQIGCWAFSSCPKPSPKG